jgi:hypothetical protein
MGRDCKHQWRLLDKRHIINTEKIIYIFYCIKCIKLRKISNEDL